MQWYYATDGQRLGPVPHFELERLVRSGTIKSDSLLWRQGMNNWQTLDEVRAADPSLISIAQPASSSGKPWADAADKAGVNRESDDALPVRTGDRFGERASPSAIDPRTDFATGTFRREGDTPRDDAHVQPEPLEFASFGARVAASLVDGVILYFIWNLVVGFVGHFYFSQTLKLIALRQNQLRPEDLPVVLPFFGMAMGLALGVTIFYDTFFILKYSATPGKRLLGLQLVKADGGPLGFARIVARSVAKIISAMTFGIGYLVVLVDEQKRGLHDFFCSTRVIKKRR